MLKETSGPTSIWFAKKWPLSRPGVNYPQTIQGIKLVGLVIDRDGERKWSFRSKGDFDCNSFARKYFEGGGHYNASGGRSSDSLEKTVEHFKQAMKENEKLLQ